MDVLAKDSSGITLRFEKKDLSNLVEAIVKNADQFGKETLDLIYLLAEQNYRMDNHFRQPPRPFGQ